MSGCETSLDPHAGASDVMRDGPGVKVCVIGGGSTYTPELVDGLVRRRGELPVREIHLVDVDVRRVGITGKFSRRMAEAAHSGIDVRYGTDLREGLIGADFVVIQLRVGGQGARLADEELGRSFGLVGQETTGVGGFACALRTIPVVLELARQIETHAPGSTVVNFANPSGLITECLLRHTPLRVVGLCNAPWNMRAEAARLLGAGPAEVELDYVGLNHLSWVRAARVRGVDRTEDLLQNFRSESRVAAADEPEVSEATLADVRAVPSYYLVYYYETNAVLDHQKTHPTRAAQVMEIERALLERYSDPALVQKPEELMLRGGAYYSEAAASLMADLWNDAGTTHVVNAQNRGAIPGWPDDVVVEVGARIGRRGAQALPVPPLRADQDALMRTVKSFELLTIEAAVQGDARLARLALLTHPLGPDASLVGAVWEEVARVNAGKLGKLDG
jgi:6-phospho-beta-glucosidase